MRQHGIPRIRSLQASNAAVRFLSIEPLLENLGVIPLADIDWVIVGGESGPKARPMDESWVVDIRDQCQSALVPFFFKQWGGTRKKQAGRELQGQTYDEMPRCYKFLPSMNVPSKSVRDLRIELTKYEENAHAS